MTEWQGAEYESIARLQQWLADDSLASLVLGGTERVLDVGCGNGKVTAEIAARLPDGSVLGVDPSHDMVTFARRTHTAANLTFEVADARTVPVKPGTVADVAKLGGDELYLVAIAPEAPEGELIPVSTKWRFGAYAGGDHALALLIVSCCTGALAPALVEMRDCALVHQRLAPPTRQC